MFKNVISGTYQVPSDWVVFIKYDPGFKEGYIKMKSYITSFTESDAQDYWDSEVFTSYTESIKPVKIDVPDPEPEISIEPEIDDDI